LVGCPVPLKGNENEKNKKSSACIATFPDIEHRFSKNPFRKLNILNGKNILDGMLQKKDKYLYELLIM
jgi:hypothetical protein